MNCPFCGKVDSQVLESRSVDEGDAIRRRRHCLSCNKRFTTLEKIKGSALWVIKKDGRREMYDREKLKKGVVRALEKRPISMEEINNIVDDVERKLLKEEKEEISTKLIGKMVMEKLKKTDKVGWLRFASVYLEFEDVSDFEKLIKNKKIK